LQVANSGNIDQSSSEMVLDRSGPPLATLYDRVPRGRRHAAPHKPWAGRQSPIRRSKTVLDFDQTGLYLPSTHPECLAQGRSIRHKVLADSVRRIEMTSWRENRQGQRRGHRDLTPCGSIVQPFLGDLGPARVGCGSIYGSSASRPWPSRQASQEADRYPYEAPASWTSRFSMKEENKPAAGGTNRAFRRRSQWAAATTPTLTHV
jgi:hypothetical protein